MSERKSNLSFVTSKGNEDAGGPGPGGKHVVGTGAAQGRDKKGIPAWAPSLHLKAGAWKHKVRGKPCQKVTSESREVSRKSFLLGIDTPISQPPLGKSETLQVLKTLLCHYFSKVRVK